MSFFRLVALVSLICVTLVPLFAQDAAGDEFGFIQGVVKFTDGSPVPNTPVTVTVNGKALPPQITTDATGTFNQMVPAGTATVTVEGVTKTVQVVAGEQKTLAIEVKQTGVIIAVSYADKSAADSVTLAAAYKSPAGNKQDLQAAKLTPGHFLFRDVPATATELSVIAREYNSTGNVAKRQQWTFTKAEELRQLTMTLDKPVKVSLLVLDADEAPIANTRINGTMTYKVLQVPFWDTGGNPRGDYSNQMNLSGRTTDATGTIDLGTWAPISCEITLRTDKQAGGTTKFDIKSDGTPQQLKYVLNLKPRTVTQTVFNADGTPAPNTPVNISYCWMSNIVLAQTTTDAKGKAIWKDLPPVRAIVWGDGVPAGVIPADAQTITTPLPVPVADNNRNFQFQVQITNPGATAMRASYISHTGNNNGGGNSGEASFDPTDDNKASEFRLGTFWVSGGSSFTLVAVVTGAQPRIATLDNIYLPYVDGDNQQNILSLELRPATVLRGKLLTKNGPLNGLNQLKIIPISQTGMPSITVSPSEQRRLSVLTPALQPDGSFSAILPGAGQYQLVVDLYDESTNPPADMLIDVPASGKDVTITLPEPFLKVPPGTQVNWVTRQAPAAPRTLVAAAYGSPMPILGPSDQILALWFRPSPDKLVIWNGLTHSQQVLTLRAAVVSVVNTTDHRSLNTLYLLPLLPNGNSYWSTDNVPRAASETQTTPLTEQGICPAIWASKYLVPTALAGMATRYTPIEIPADGPRDIAMTVDTNASLPFNHHSIRLKLLQGDIEQLRKGGTDRILTTCDTALLVNTDRYLNAWGLNGNQNYEVPLDAKTITLAWPGVGVAQDIPIPDGENPTVAIPVWNPGASIAGKILLANGAPYANKPVTVRNSGVTDSSAALRLTTDAQGGFTAKGLLPGMVTVFIENNYDQENAYGGWVVDVPKDGVKNLTLHIAAAPVRLNFNGSANIAWWFPDKGQPQLLPVLYSSCAAHDVASGSGWLWWADGSRGTAQYTRFNLTAGQQYLQYDQNTNSGPSLGLYFPLDLIKGMPGAVTLLGLDDRAKLQVRFSQMDWKPSTILNKVVAQINAVPPGKYRVLVETLSGTAETTVTITNNGGIAEFDYPAAPAVPAAPATAIAPANQPAAAMWVD